MDPDKIQAQIDAVDDAYFYSMRDFDARVDRDEVLDRLHEVKTRAVKINQSRQDAIRARQREMHR